ncbi:18328_t:CDS:1, partial [Gigaspora rosea]
VYDYKERPDDFIKLLKEVKLSVNDLKDANALHKMIKKLIKISYDAECLIYLQEHFKELENDSNLLYEIRSRLLELFKGKKLDWNDKNVTSLHKLLKDRNLKWQHREYASILEAIAESNQVNVLKSFPEIFNFISGLKLNAIKKKLEQESTKWFIKICKQQKRVSKIQESSAYNTFQYLSE